MKAKIYDRIVLRVDIQLRNVVVPRGTEATIVGVYTDPIEGYDADADIPAPDLVGGKTWKNITVHPDQFEVIAPSPSSQATDNQAQ